MVAILAARFAPFNFTDIAGFPNTVPAINVWGDCLPRFRESKEDNPSDHLVKFHECMDRLDLYHEDVRMKMFMYSLEGDARQWYRSLPPSSISSLREFHAAFTKYYKGYFSPAMHLENCCEQFEPYIKQAIEMIHDVPDEKLQPENCEDSLEYSHSDSDSFYDHMDVYPHEQFAANYLFEDQSLTKKIIVEDLTVDKIERPVATDAFGLAADVSYGHNSNDDQATYMHSFFQYDREEKVRGSQISDNFSDQPIFDEYSDGVEKIPTSNFADSNNNQQVYDSYEVEDNEGINDKFHEQLNFSWPVKANQLFSEISESIVVGLEPGLAGDLLSFPSSVVENEKLIEHIISSPQTDECILISPNSYNHLAIPNTVNDLFVRGNCHQHFQEGLATLNGYQALGSHGFQKGHEDCNPIKNTELSRQQDCLLCRLKVCHVLQDPVAIWMDALLAQVSYVSVFGMLPFFSNKYQLLTNSLLHFLHLLQILFKNCLHKVIFISQMLLWLHWKVDYT